MSAFTHELGVLLRPRWLEARRWASGREEYPLVRVVAVALLAVVFWGGVYLATRWFVLQCLDLDMLGLLVARKMLSLVLLFFFGLLFLSNLLTAFSAFFISDDLPFLWSAPLDRDAFYLSRFTVTLVTSSTMVVLFGTPVFIAYGVAFGASWTYYAFALGVVLPFLAVPAVGGVFLAQLLLTVFPARSAREVLGFMAIALFIALYLMFRFANPEDVLSPTGFGNMAKLFAAMRAQDLPVLPSHWAAEAIYARLGGPATGTGSPWLYLAALWSTAGACGYGGLCASRALWYPAWSRSREGKQAKVSRTPFVEWLVAACSAPFTGLSGVVVRKDLKIFLRDPAQWTQVFLLGALVVVYLYNFHQFRTTGLAVVLGDRGFYFLNLGLGGFVTAAVAVRFVFPAVSLEGRSFWIIRTSPVTMKELVWAKFWVAFVPLALMGAAMAGVSAWVLELPTGFRVASIATVTLMALCVTGLGVGMGALYPRFHAENVTQIASGAGGILYMLVSMAAVVLVILAEAWPVALFLRFEQGRMVSQGDIAAAVACFVALAALCVASVSVPLRLGARALAGREE